MKDLVEKYIKLRDAKAKAKGRYEDQVAELTAVMDRIEAAILAEFTKAGIDSCSTGEGTAYRSVKTSASVADWDATLNFIRANDLWHMLERRVSKDAVVQWKNENNDLPPGLNWNEIVSINVRRK